MKPLREEREDNQQIKHLFDKRQIKITGNSVFAKSAYENISAMMCHLKDLSCMNVGICGEQSICETLPEIPK